MQYVMLIYETPADFEAPGPSEVESLDHVLEWAARCPAAPTGAVEVRPMDAALHETITTP